MKPIYIDIHIHTSDNPNKINEEYNVRILLEKVKSLTGDSEHLLSLSDHNTINKSVYIRLNEIADNVILGAELHIKNHESKPPYHCHILFNVPITEEHIDIINESLDKLYPDKIVTKEMEWVPHLEQIINEFDNLDIMLLPHGGQSHSTFDNSIAEGMIFDTTLERNIYYNHFEGFTARSNEGLEHTIEYFQRLGIEGFVNLLTCTDNYKPVQYPSVKAADAAEFIPTWMMAKPTFNGLRLSLSEADRFVYSNEAPNEWSECIERVILQNDKVDIDVSLEPGLNVVIGGSSTGKTLIVDSIYRKIKNDFENSNYLELGVEDINVINPSGIVPYYISQNYIVEIINNSKTGNGIENIDLIKKVFCVSSEEKTQTRDALKLLKDDLHKLIDQVKVIQEEEKNISKIPVVSSLLAKNYANKNLIEGIIPTNQVEELITTLDRFFKTSLQALDTLKETMNVNPLSENVDKEINLLKAKLERFEDKTCFEGTIREILTHKKTEVDIYLSKTNKEAQEKKRSYSNLLSSIRKYISAKKTFDSMIIKISTYSYEIQSKEIVAEGHTLYVENSLALNKNTFLETLNSFLKRGCKIDEFEDIAPNLLYKTNYKTSPKVDGYDDFVAKISSAFEQKNKRTYKITTKEGKDFDKLSAGWKTSVLLDLILGYEDDYAPLIIDQPEDNLAPEYINKNLIKSIKKIKGLKQIILVSHNATIPMLGDAQNVLLCRAKDDKIVIRSAELEGEIEGKAIVDYIASITDGGKASIKKRVKKYNLKKFRGED